MKSKQELILGDIHSKDLNEGDMYIMKLISKHIIESSHKHRLKGFLTKLEIKSANPFGFTLKVKCR